MGAAAGYTAREAALQATLVEVATRRQAEERAPISADGLDALGEAWAAMLTAASALRRKVGGAAKAQSEQVAALAASWAEIRVDLSSSLPEDPELTGPPDVKEASGCLIM